MPFSSGENAEDVVQFVKENNIMKVLDVGAGSGTYSKLLRPHIWYIEAIEIWPQYINQFGLYYLYDTVQLMDARNIPASHFEMFDLVIFGDILEHMTEEEALNLWNNSRGAKFTMLSVPTIHYPQGEEFGNPYEVHVQDHLTPEHIEETYGPFVFSRVYEVTGTFIRRGVV